jgi:hypothetical protein
MLRQLGARLAPRLLQTESAAGLKELSCSLHSSAAAQGVGIPERKSKNEFLGLTEGELRPLSNPAAPGSAAAAVRHLQAVLNPPRADPRPCPPSPAPLGH